MPPFLEASECQILVAPDATGFVTCDNPVVPVPPQGFDFTSGLGVGFLFPGAMRYFPLTRRLCLRLDHFDHGFQYRKVNSEIVRTINLNVTANSERFVMGPDETQLKNVVARSNSKQLDVGERFSVEIVEENQNGGLVKVMMRPRRYFYCINN